MMVSPSSVTTMRSDLRRESGDVLVGEEPALGGIVILAQRVTLKCFVSEDAAEVRMPLEADAVHVPRLALEPVEGLEQVSRGGDRFPFRDAHLEADALVVLQRVELVDEVEAWLAARVIGAEEVERKREAQILFEGAQHVDDLRLVDEERRQILPELLRFRREADFRGDLLTAHIHGGGCDGNVGFAVGRRRSRVGDGAELRERAHSFVRRAVRLSA
jgi:hypothetical protein